MISVLAQAQNPQVAPVENKYPSVDLSELVSIQDAIEPFVSLYRSSGESVRLHCVVPTSFSPETCADLHDLHDLRVRSLIYLHQLLETLHGQGVPASYKLSSSTSPLSMCLVCAIPYGHDATTVKASACEAMQHTKFCAREKALLANLPYGPALVIT